MQLRSLGYRTDLFFHRFEGEVTDRGRYLAIRTPANPGYRWGNFLLFDAPPQEGDFERWTKLFGEEIGKPPESEHMVFAWDEPSGEAGQVRPFLEAGFELDESIVFATDSVRLPPKVNSEVEMRPLRTDAEFEETVANHVAGRHEREDEMGYRTYFRQSMAAYRKMIAAGLGQWFGAFLEGRLVADMGLFHQGGLARYQSVLTHPDFRRRGICGTLVHWVGRYGLERMGAEKLVIVADGNYHAAGIYASVGFEPVERQAGLELVRGRTKKAEGLDLRL